MGDAGRGRTVAWCEAGDVAGTWEGRRARRPSGIPIMNRPVRIPHPPSRVPHPASRIPQGEPDHEAQAVH